MSEALEFVKKNMEGKDLSILTWFYQMGCRFSNSLYES